MNYTTYDDLVAIIECECARCGLSQAETLEVVDRVLEKLCNVNAELTEHYVKKATLNTIRSLKRKKNPILYADLSEYENLVVENEEGQTLSAVLDDVLAELYTLLTPRQLKIFELTAHNYKVTEIANLLNISTRLVVKERQKLLQYIKELFSKYHISAKRQRFRAPNKRSKRY